MMVAALRRDASTSRSRSWPSDERVPEPGRSGARSPWNFCSGNGPLWQRMQVLERSTTSARPRAASPRAFVSGSRMASPTNVYGGKVCAPAGPDSVSRPASIIPIWLLVLAKGFRRNRLEPGFRCLGLALAHFARSVDRTGRALDLGELAVLRLIDAGQRESIAGRDGVVAGATQPRSLGRLARQRSHDAGRARLALWTGGGRGLWNLPGNA